ncbi:MAG: hypothetical protein JOZ08_26375 [Verrucomicrobia bacterium]|nr:hypothetical protein [Verrucomicrobiota bacterium]MBV8277208.1 hypothetical protein [Verrucomicrobiota bacterium]
MNRLADIATEILYNDGEFGMNGLRQNSKTNANMVSLHKVGSRKHANHE